MCNALWVKSNRQVYLRWMCWGARYIPGPWRCLCCNSCAFWRAGSWHSIFGGLKHSLKVTETDIPAGKHWIKIHKEQPVPQGSDKAQYALVLLNLSSIQRQSVKTQLVWSPTTQQWNSFTFTAARLTRLDAKAGTVTNCLFLPVNTLELGMSKC